MIDHAALRRAMTEYVRTSLGTYSVGEMLYRLTDQAVEVLGCDGGGVSVGEEELLRFVTATDGMIARIEEDQITAEQGPCHSAFQEGKQVAVVDITEQADRWPAYCRTAIGHGCRSVLGVPMAVEDTMIGALNLYRHEPHEWDDEERAVAQLLADMASGYIGNLRALSDSRRLTEQRQRALDSRVIIEQAKGIVATRHDIAMQRAFELLRRHARSQQRHLHEVAREVVEDRLRL